MSGLIFNSFPSQDNAADIIFIIESDRTPAAYRKSRARLIQKIFERYGRLSHGRIQ
jgi:hypothetical protein